MNDTKKDHHEEGNNSPFNNARVPDLVSSNITHITEQIERMNYVLYTYKMTCSLFSTKCFRHPMWRGVITENLFIFMQWNRFISSSLRWFNSIGWLLKRLTTVIIDHIEGRHSNENCKLISLTYCEESKVLSWYDTNKCAEFRRFEIEYRIPTRTINSSTFALISNYWTANLGNLQGKISNISAY